MSITDLQAFKSAFRGQVFEPEDAGYDEARKIWNASIDKRPQIIARCSGVADVVDAVNFGRANDLLTAIRGGGHNVGGRALCDGGLVIDLSPMRGCASTRRPAPRGRRAASPSATSTARPRSSGSPCRWGW
jgi:hypothetical protein